MDYVGLNEEATGWFQRNSHGLFAAGIQATQAGDMWALEEDGFAGLGLNSDIFPGIGRTAEQDIRTGRRADAGVAGRQRLAAAPAREQADPERDRRRERRAADAGDDRGRQGRLRPARPGAATTSASGSTTRSSTSSPAKGGTHTSSPRSSTCRTGGDCRSGERVRAKHVVMACWNRVTARLVDGLPHDQVKNLDYARKAPLIYCRVGLNNWQAFADAKISSVSPRGNSLFWDSTTLQAGTRFGGVYGPNAEHARPAGPDHRSPARRATSRKLTQLESYEDGRQTMLEMSFRDYERAIVDVLDRSLNVSGGDFDPGRDIDSIMVNRWNYGYAYELCSTFDPSLFGPERASSRTCSAGSRTRTSRSPTATRAPSPTRTARSTRPIRAVQDLPASASLTICTG